MKKAGMRAALAAGMLWGLVLPLQAGIGDQDGHAGETLVIDNVYSNHGGSHFYVGSSGAGNTLIVTNDGMLGGVDRFFVGEQAGAVDNMVLVTGAGSSITNNGIFFLGQYAGGNILLIEDGGRVYSADRVLIGHRDGDDNRAVIDNGTWVQGRLELGNAWGAGEISHHNSMVITNGGKVFTGFTGGGNAREGYAYIGRNNESTGNTVVVTGEGSYWGLTNWLEVGQSGSAHNSLIIERGGVVSNANYAYIGAGNSTNNSVLVTGEGSRWHVDGTNYASRIGTGSASLANSLTVTDKGLVVMDGGLTIGGSATALSNRVTVSDGGRLEVNDDSLRMYGTDGALRITGGGEVAVSVADGDATYAFDPRGTRNLILVDGDGSLLELDRHIWDNGSGNMLVITNGGVVRYTQSLRALVMQGSDFLMHVSGTDSHYDGNHILMGRGSGHDNQVLIDDGGRVSVTYLYISEQSASSNNSVLVTGSGSRLESSDANGIRVGNEGSGATMTVEDGASVVSVNAYVGQSATSADNLAVITGDGTTWTNTGTFFVGYGGGANNRLRVADGALLASLVEVGSGGTLELDGGIVNGRVDIATGGILEGAGSIDNRLFLAGTVQDATGLTITDYLRLEDGGLVSTALTLQGQLRMWGTGHTGTLGVGADVILTDNNIRIENDGNELRIIDGAMVAVTPFSPIDSLRISGENNLVLIDNAELDLAVHAYIGGENNNVVVTNGGSFSLQALVLCESAGHFGQRVQVTGTGTTYEGGHLLIGREGYDNEVRIENGATAQATYAYISERAVASNNTLLVTGGGTSLDFTDSLVGRGVHVGSEGSRARMTVADGATVDSINVYIGYGEASADNVATITGAGSAWTNTGVFFIGYGGAGGNLLQVHDGALLESDTIEIGAGGMLELSNTTVYVTAESDPFVVHEGGLLRGAGTIEAEDFMNPPDDPFFIDGTVSPGFSTGTLGFGGDLTLGANAVVVMEIAGEEDFDQLIVFDPWATGVYGNLTFNGTLQLSLLGGYEPQLHDSFQLFTADSYLDVENIFIDDDDAQLQESWWSWQLNPDGTVSVIPEAATTGSMLLGLALLAVLRRRGRM